MKLETETIDRIIELAQDPQIVLKNIDETVDITPTAVLPAGSVIHSLEKYLPAPLSLRGKYYTAHIRSYLDYIEENKTELTAIFLHEDNMKAVAAIDHSNTKSIGWGKHEAALDLKKTAEFNALVASTRPKKQFGQREFTDFISDWSKSLLFSAGENMAISPSKAAQRIQRIDVSQKKQTSSEEGNMRESMSSFEEIEITSDAENAMPELMTMKCNPYHGLMEREFNCRIIYMADKNGKVTVGYRINQYEAIMEDIRNEFRTLLNDAPEMERLPIYVGVFERK